MQMSFPLPTSPLYVSVLVHKMDADELFPGFAGTRALSVQWGYASADFQPSLQGKGDRLRWMRVNELTLGLLMR